MPLECEGKKLATMILNSKQTNWKRKSVPIWKHPFFLLLLFALKLMENDGFRSFCVRLICWSFTVFCSPYPAAIVILFHHLYFVLVYTFRFQVRTWSKYACGHTLLQIASTNWYGFVCIKCDLDFFDATICQTERERWIEDNEMEKCAVRDMKMSNMSKCTTRMSEESRGGSTKVPDMKLTQI